MDVFVSAGAPGGADVEDPVNKIKVEQTRDVEAIPGEGIAPIIPEPIPRFTLAEALGVLAVVLGIFIVWRTSSSLLVIFAGILLASFIDSCALALGRIVPVGRVWRLSLVIVVMAGLMVIGAVSGARKLPEQAVS